MRNLPKKKSLFAPLTRIIRWLLPAHSCSRQTLDNSLKLWISSKVDVTFGFDPPVSYENGRTCSTVHQLYSAFLRDMDFRLSKKERSSVFLRFSFLLNQICKIEDKEDMGVFRSPTKNITCSFYLNGNKLTDDDFYFN